MHVFKFKRGWFDLVKKFSFQSHNTETDLYGKDSGKGWIAKCGNFICHNIGLIKMRMRPCLLYGFK